MKCMSSLIYIQTDRIVYSVIKFVSAVVWRVKDFLQINNNEFKSFECQFLLHFSSTRLNSHNASALLFSSFLFLCLFILLVNIDRVRVRLDDVLIFSSSLEQHIKDVREVLGLLKKNELFVKLKKCELFKNEVSFLGHRVSGDGISVEKDKIKVINEWQFPKPSEASNHSLEQHHIIVNSFLNFLKLPLH